VDAGYTKAIINVQPLKSLHMGVIKQLVQAMQLCKESGLNFVLVGNKQLTAECKGFEETRSWIFHETMDEAKASFTKTSQLASV
jgi:two-component system cell cycle response regulator